MVYVGVELLYAQLVEDGLCARKSMNSQKCHECRNRSHFMNCECHGFMVLYLNTALGGLGMFSVTKQRASACQASHSISTGLKSALATWQALYKKLGN